MTLNDLARMRRLRARPALPVVITDQASVHEFCAVNDWPVIWQPALDAQSDLRPLHGLDVWVIGYESGLRLMAEAIKVMRPASMWVTGRFAFSDRINSIIGRDVCAWN